MFNIKHYSPLRIVLNVASPTPKSTPRPKRRYQKKSKTPKTRAEIQRAYRARKKAAMGKEYYEVEKQRVRNYYHRVKHSEKLHDVIKREENRKRCREAMRAYRDRKKAAKLNEMIELAELEKVKCEAITAIKSELMTQSEGDENFLNETTGRFENATPRGDESNVLGHNRTGLSENKESAVSDDFDQNITI